MRTLAGARMGEESLGFAILQDNDWCLALSLGTPLGLLSLLSLLRAPLAHEKVI